MVNKKPLEPDNFKRFRVWILEMEELYGLTSVKDIHRQVMLLIGEIDKHIFEKENSIKKDTSQTRKFIVMFQNHYRIMTDYEYGRRISSVDAKTIGSLIDELNNVNCTVEDYLGWFFERFLPNNEKMCPPTVGLACSKFALSKFLYEHKEEIKRREEKAILLLSERDMYNRSKELFKKTNDSKIHIWAEQYKGGNITLDEWKKLLSEAEEGVGEQNG